METRILLLSDARGIYIPRDFAEAFSENFDNIGESDLEILKNPEHEEYWDVWDFVLNHAVLIVDQINSKKWNLLPGVWHLYQDGDLFLVHESYNWENEEL